MDQSLIATLAIVVIVVIVASVIWFVIRKRQSDQLRERFGDEYDRTVANTGRRSVAEENLREREKRVAKFDIRPLSDDEQSRFTGEWKETKAVFVDSPGEAVLRSDRLLSKMMETRGYPMADFDRRYEDLSVDHGMVARHYRDGHEIAVKQDATTEEMRRALNHYERLFDELVRDSGTGTADTTRPTDLDGDGHADVVERPVTRPE